MTAATIAYRVGIPSFIAPPTVAIRFRLLRDGEATASAKELRLYASRDDMTNVAAVFWAEVGSDGFSQYYRLDLATLLAQGDWLGLGLDDASPRVVRSAYLNLAASGTYTFNLSSGDGGGDAGTPAVVQARVRVDGLLAAREVVFVEKPSDGQWRLAGHGLAVGGDAALDIRVTDGSVYAIGVDDWGTAFTGSLAVTVGQTIRPSEYTGWLYRITEAGTLPASEPEWWAAEGDNVPRLLGTARAVAVRYYQPLAHGPVTVEII